MGIDWNSLYEQAKQSVSQASQDLINTGVPAIKAGLEQQAIDWLTKQNKETQAELTKNVGEVLSRPSDPNSLGAVISSNVTKAATSHYAPLILIGVGGLLVFGMFLKGK